MKFSRDMRACSMLHLIESWDPGHLIQMLVMGYPPDCMLYLHHMF